MQSGAVEVILWLNSSIGIYAGDKENYSIFSEEDHLRIIRMAYALIRLFNGLIYE